MNSSSSSSSTSNSNNRYSNFNEMNHMLGFNTRPLDGAPASSGMNHSQQRNNKVRKHTVSRNYIKSNDNDVGLGFSQFMNSSESVFGNLSSGNVVKDKFLFGVNRGDNVSVDCNVIVDDMSKLKIENGKEDITNVTVKLNSVDKSIVDELPEVISKLKIEGENNVGNVEKSNVAFVDSNVAVELENAVKKINISDPVEISSGNDNVSSSVVGSGSFTSNSEKMAEFAFTSKLDDIGAPVIEFKTPDMRSNMFCGLNTFEAKKVYVKDIRSKKKKGKLKNPIVGQSRVRQDLMFGGRSSFESFDSYKAYSPMDIFPNDEKVGDSYSRETSVTSEDASQINDEDNEVSEPHINEVSETESFKSANENMEFSSDTFVTALDSDESLTTTSGKLFNFASKSDDISKVNFTFAASSSSQSQLPLDMRHHKKKHPQKIVHDLYTPTAEFFPISGSSSMLPNSLIKKNDNLKPMIEQDFRHDAIITPSSSKIAEEACEKWRLRGNQAYSNGDLAKAEDCYTQGLNSVSQNEKSRSCLRALMLCYSNRAATRISLGRMKDALGDCLMATNIDPNFIKVQVRAAHCYLAMGEIDDAKKQYMKCLQFATDKSVDQKVIAEASEGLEKAEKVSDCIMQCTDLFQRQTSDNLECALRVINEALQISSCSQKLMQMKAEALFMLRKYEQVIQVCEQTLSSDEAETLTSSSSRLWKPHLIVKSYFYVGRLDDALEFIKKQEISDERVGITSRESAVPLADTIRELLSHKTAGNEAYKSGKHAEAVEHYTAALSCNAESRPFASVCFCNRAAAYKCLGQITDAIADCSLAIALDPNYLKPISRRASLYELIRDYGHAAKDLQKLVSLLTTHADEKGDLSGPSDKLSRVNELKQTQLQLMNVEEESRKGIPLNVYIILGVESTASAADIKKAYRKAALRHHPDKAAQSLGKSDDGDDGLWKEIAENVHKDAERLFKMIGEAYAVLSNPSKRARYDEDEEARNEGSRFTRSNSSRMAANVHNSVFERSGSEKKTGSSFRYPRYY